MLNQYYDLIDEQNIPTGFRFIDPYDNHLFVVAKKETLPQFISRIRERRENNDIPKIEDSQLRVLVVASFYQQSNQTQIKKYFEPRSALPHMKQVISLANVLAHEAIHGGTVGVVQRRERAAYCLDKCPFHTRGKKWSAALNKAVELVSRVVGVKDVTHYPEEEYLGVCQACGGCTLKNKIRMQNAAILAGLTPENIDTMLRTWGSRAFNKCFILKEARENAQTENILVKKLNYSTSNGLKLYQAVKVQELKVKQDALRKKS